MKIKDCMKRNVYTVNHSTTIAAAAKVFFEKHIGSLPIINEEGKLVGLLQLRDMLELVLPDFLNLLDDFDFVPDFGAIEARRPSPETLARPVSEIMQEPISVQAESGVLRAFSLLRKHQLHDLPVVDADLHVVGIVSPVDMGTAFVANWNLPEGDEK
jgi:CBS domain-containing protein